MATLPNIEIASSAFVDLYAATSIVVGTALLIQNKGVASIRVIEDSTLPQPTDTRGVIVQPGDWLGIKAGSEGAYAIGYTVNGTAEIVVQDNS